MHRNIYKVDKVKKIKVGGSAACWRRSEIIQSQKDEVDDHQDSACAKERQEVALMENRHIN